MRYLPLILILILGCTSLPTDPSDSEFIPPPTATQSPDCNVLFYGYLYTPFGFVSGARIEFRCYGHNPEMVWVTHTNDDGYYEVTGEESHEGHRGVGIGDSLMSGFLIDVLWIDTFGTPPERYDFYTPPE